MKIGFNQATTMKYSTLEKDLTFCEKYGYDYIEVRLDKLRDYLQTKTVDDLVQYFATHNIKPYSFNALEFITFRDEAGYAQIKSDLAFLCDVGQKIACKKIIIVPTFDIGDYTTAQIKEESVRVINDMADYAEPFGMQLAFEFVGYPQCSVNTFAQAYDIVEAVNRDSVGVVLDCFHFHAMNSHIEDLKKADPKKIAILHLDDSEDYPVGALRDDKRVWPGDGVVDLDAIFSAIKEIGYDELASLELFRPEYYEMDIEEVIRIGKEKTVKVVEKYFPIG
ncbi:MAG: sugar phosphate isomerase/epimerase family protein [Christensenellales bacterium]|jgi:2-keto-myo-inositol isomerase